MPRLVGAHVSGATTMCHATLVVSPCADCPTLGLVLVPGAMITMSNSIMNRESGIGMGRRLPDSAGSPSYIRMHSIVYINRIYKFVFISQDMDWIDVLLK